MNDIIIQNIFKKYFESDHSDLIISNADYLLQRVFKNLSERDIKLIKIKYLSTNITYKDISDKYNITEVRIGQIIRRFNRKLEYEIDIFLRNYNTSKYNLSQFKINDLESELGTMLCNTLNRYFKNHTKNNDPTLQDVKNLNEDTILGMRNMGIQSYERLMQVIKEKEEEIKKIKFKLKGE